MEPTQFYDHLLKHVQVLSNYKDISEAKLLEYVLNASVQFAQSLSGFICIVNNQGSLMSPLITTGQIDVTPKILNLDHSELLGQIIYKNGYAIVPIPLDNNLTMVIGLSSFDTTYVVFIKIIAEVGYKRLEHLKTIHRLRKSQRIFNLTFEQVGSGMCQTDLDGYILDANQNYCDLLGYSRDEITKLRVKDITFPEDWEIDKVFKNQLFNYEIPYFSMDKRYFRKDGSLIWVTITVTLMHGDAFEEDFLIGVIQDISTQKAAEALMIQNNENLERLVRERTLKLEELNAQLMIANTIDTLTNLYNRRYISSKINEEIERYKRTKRSFCLILTDIDYFKEVNDQYGHDCGDDVLQTISRLLHKEIRSVDTLSRWGGEEFLLLLPDTTIEAAYQVAERMRMKVHMQPFVYEGMSFNLTMTFGLSVSTENATLKALVKKADLALYTGKQSGRNCIRSAQDSDAFGLR